MRGEKFLLGHAEPTWSFLPTVRFVAGTKCQFHVLMPIDCEGHWENVKPGPMPPPRYSDEELFPPVRHCLNVGGTVTPNVGIYQEGHISATTLAQLKRLRNTLRAG